MVEVPSPPKRDRRDRPGDERSVSSLNACSDAVISNHLEHEERFRTPELLAAHGVRRAINVILQGDGSTYGVLEVDSRATGEFTENDIAFLQGAANILGMAIERQRQEQALREAVLRAKADAGVLASALDLKVLRILAVESSDGGGPFQHIVPMARSIAAAKAPTPIEPGTIEVTANVTLTVEVGAAAR